MLKKYVAGLLAVILAFGIVLPANSFAAVHNTEQASTTPVTNHANSNG